MTQLEHSVPNITAERTEGQERAKKGRISRLLGRVAAKAIPYVGVGAVVAAAYLTVDNASGEHRYSPPTSPVKQEVTEELLAAPADEMQLSGTPDVETSEEIPAASDGLRVGTWNMWNVTKERLPEIASLIDEYELDVLTLQEVSMGHIEHLRRYFPEWGIVPVTADPMIKTGGIGFKNGFGNVVMVRHPVDEDGIESIRLRGTGLTGIIKSEPYQEDRAAVAVPFEVDGVEHTIITVHLSHIMGSEVQQQQMEELLEFVFKHARDGRKTIVCGDFNQTMDTVREAFERFKAETGSDIDFIVPETGPTFIDGRTIDGCASTEEPELALSDKRWVTDHYPVIVEFGGFDTDKPAATLSALPRGFLSPEASGK
jgi:endonuclease/exonuclease/phosphatase family metal-dependent hydrolase